MKKYIVTESQLKKIVDTLVTEQQQISESKKVVKKTTKTKK